MASTRDLAEQLLNEQDSLELLKQELPADREYILVMKHYKFHKKLSIELYRAATTQSGKIRNPLVLINPLDISLNSRDETELKFYAAISRFQNNPSAPKTIADIEALKLILSNPLQLKFFIHDPEFSSNVSAGSLKPVEPGEQVSDITVMVNRKQDLYEITAQLETSEPHHQLVPLHSMQYLFDWFLLNHNRLLLPSNFHLQKLAKFFTQHPAGIRLPANRFEEFNEQVLKKLQDHVTVQFNYLPASSPGVPLPSLERIIYLSDLDQHIAINPVMKYGEVEIPVLSKRQVFIRNEEGELVPFSRNDEEEIRFTALLLRQHPDFNEQLDNDLTYFYLHKQRFLQEDWFLDAFEYWQEAGIQVLGFNQVKNNKLNGNKAKVNIQVTSGLNWFNTDMNVRFGKKKASLKQLHQSVRNKSKYVELDDGTMGILPIEWLKKFEQYFKAGEIDNDRLITTKISFEEMKKLYGPDEMDDSVKEEIRLYETRLSHFAPAPVPAGLNATLRHYQKQGLDWLNFLDDCRFGGCLADDMGLGKTIQVIAFLLLLKVKHGKQTSIALVPTSLIFNWEAELNRFAPSIRYLVLYGANRMKHTNDLGNYDLIITSYGTLLSDIGHLKHFEFNYIFLDESQNIRNPNSQRYASVMQLKARNRIAITGTPIENNTMDLFAQLSFACPGLLGSKRSFRDLYSIPIDKFKSLYNLRDLQQKISPFILRRTKKEVAKELPEKTEMIIYCPMEEAQRKVYDTYEREFRDYISGATEEELSRQSVHVLKGLTRLRQVCDSPLLLQDEKLFSDRSSKIEILLEQIENNAPSHKILVFSQFVSMLELIRKELDERNIGYCFLSGSTKNREEVVNRFQHDKNIRVFLVSLKAGGTGLNLTEADYVYIVDPWWNPAVENQAIDRSYRIGQKKNVVAVRLICPDTLEEKILKLQESKRSLSDQLIRTDQSFFQSMKKEDWVDILKNPG